jgi:hypothetical protein
MQLGLLRKSDFQAPRQKVGEFGCESAKATKEDHKGDHKERHECDKKEGHKNDTQEGYESDKKSHNSDTKESHKGDKIDARRFIRIMNQKKRKITRM